MQLHRIGIKYLFNIHLRINKPETYKLRVRSVSYWCYAVDALITSAEEHEDSVQLGELVSTFNLSGSLLAV